MIFLIDEMYPPETINDLIAAGHEATEPRRLGIRSDEEVIAHARRHGAVIVTENYADYAEVVDVVVLFAAKDSLKSGSAMAQDLASQLLAWAEETPDPPITQHWL